MSRLEKIEWVAEQFRAMSNDELKRWLWWHRPTLTKAQVRALHLILGPRFWGCW